MFQVGGKLPHRELYSKMYYHAKYVLWSVHQLKLLVYKIRFYNIFGSVIHSIPVNTHRNNCSIPTYKANARIILSDSFEGYPDYFQTTRFQQ